MEEQDSEHSASSELPIEDWLSLAEAAAEVGLSQNTLRKYAINGRLQAKKIGRNWVTTRGAVRQYLQSRDATKVPYRRRSSH
ncbi:helix-turn-helix domain-containing protein [Gloeobacter kilaueensis]|uniref:Helix-turn-helix domain-containing protein n=1 Tax=Gloeobacter kilaueensis (strain ATCC BAA-2537 / CCAP 1431/1 / ULC 316 / JS1) TaxID=1183438 RepID=U5QJR2_GLOK1|nr:hypothetical protein GKIL_2986 [Gloeobacter kilaueensis JS1]